MANILPVTVLVPSSPALDEAAIEERAGLAADLVPPAYLDTWARLNCQKPSNFSETEWRRALDDGGRFLDRWGYIAQASGWTPAEIFDVRAGLVWRLTGERVEAFNTDRVQLSDGRTIRRTEARGDGTRAQARAARGWLKARLEQAVSRRLGKRGELRRSEISWHRDGDLVAAAIIVADFREEPFGWITLKLGNLEQRLQCCGAWRNFGGIQWYFICPVTARDASVPRLPPGAKHFASRRAWGRQVAYGSQFEMPRDRARSQAEKVRRRLGGEQYSPAADSDPPKPKGMHWRTYRAHLERCETYEMKCNLGFVALAERLRARLANR